MAKETDTSPPSEDFWLRRGDMGYVRGRSGLWMICGGAPPPAGIFPCSQEAHRLSEAADPIAVWCPWHGTELCYRAEFIAYHTATQAERASAMGGNG